MAYRKCLTIFKANELVVSPIIDKPIAGLREIIKHKVFHTEF